MKVIIVSQNSIRKGLLKANGFEMVTKIGAFTLYKSSKTSDIVVHSSGVTVSLEKDLLDLFDKYKPLFVVSLGFAASIDQNVKIGSVLMFENISVVTGPMALWNSDDAQNSDDVQSLAAPINRPISALFETLDENRGWFYEGSLLTTPRMVRTSKMKHWLSKEFDVCAIDEDGFYIASVCRDRQLPCAVIRGINNDHKTNSPYLTGLYDRRENLKFWRILVSPHGYLSCVKIYFRNLKAHKKLERLMDRVLGLEIH